MNLFAGKNRDVENGLVHTVGEADGGTVERKQQHRHISCKVDPGEKLLLTQRAQAGALW